MSLIKNVLKQLIKRVVTQLGLTASSTRPSDLAQQTTLIISKKEMNDMKIVKSLEESALLMKGDSKTIKN